MTLIQTSYQNKTIPYFPFPFPTRIPRKPRHYFPLKSQQHNGGGDDNDDGILSEDVKLIAKLKSRHNYIRVLEVSRRADHPLAGTRLLLLDRPGNIHSIASLSGALLTGTYFDVFATFPPALPAGPIALLGLGAGSAAAPILRLHATGPALHAWELDPAVLSVARQYFGLARLEAEFPSRLRVHVGDALGPAGPRGGFAGLAVDLFSRGRLLPELQRPGTWAALAKCLRKGGRAMVNVGGACVEAEEAGRDGRVLMEETLEAMGPVFGGKVWVLSVGDRRDESTVAITGDLPDRDEWKQKLPKSLRGYIDMWRPFREF